jgi:hypothetical protein
MKKSVEIDDDISRQRSGRGSMKDGKPGIIVHDQGVLREWLRAVRAPFREALNPCRDPVFIVHDEHMAILQSAELLLERDLLHWKV